MNYRSALKARHKAKRSAQPGVRPTITTYLLAVEIGLGYGARDRAQFAGQK
jgi:hypothetical protein